MISLASHLAGVVQLILVVSALGFSAFRIRARLLPDFEGAPARLAEAVIGIAALILISELLGLFGLIQAWALMLASLGLALFCWLRLYRGEASTDLRPPAPAITSTAMLLALAVAGLLVAQWAAFTTNSLDHGITNFDSVWYHMPFAADMYQSGSSLSFLRTETVFLNWFYPQNSEIVHAAGMVLTDRDFFSIFLNMGWLALALLAGWCVGRPYGRPHLTMIAAAILLTTHSLVAREPGTGKNDIVAIALTLSVIAILINRAAAERDGRGRLGPDWSLAIAGLAAGLAAGTKVTALAPVLMITFAVLYAAVAGQRLRAAAVWLGAAFVGGGFWYLRSLIASGSPLPQIESLGPLDLPGPERLQVGRPDFNVLHYLFDADVWSGYFLPGLRNGFGELWPLLILGALAGTVALVLRGPGRLTRGLGIAALLAIAAYLITPLSAAGLEGQPTAFAINLRFLVPALAMAAVLLPLLPWFSRGWPRIALGASLVVLFLVTGREDMFLGQPGWVFGIAFAALAVGLPGLAWILKDRIEAATGVANVPGIACAAAAAMFLLASWPLANSYFDSRYRDFEPEYGMAGPYRLASELSGARIGLAGSTAGFRQYGFYGEDLSNEVTYIGREVSGGGFEAIGRCDEFRRAVNDADLDYLVTSRYLNFNDADRPLDSPEGFWALGDPALTRIGPAGQTTVWRVVGEMDPDGCAQIEPGSEFIPGLR